jgi:crotonobetainyl-CoA:carnitine CoA-transferase CaiB-like acyl-CoA transferase
MTGPLDGITVVDLTRALAGPHATMMMARLGARIIKNESPQGGDDTRGWGPPSSAQPAKNSPPISSPATGTTNLSPWI